MPARSWKRLPIGDALPPDGAPRPAGEAAIRCKPLPARTFGFLAVLVSVGYIAVVSGSISRARQTSPRAFAWFVGALSAAAAMIVLQWLCFRRHARSTSALDPESREGPPTTPRKATRRWFYNNLGAPVGSPDPHPAPPLPTTDPQSPAIAGASSPGGCVTTDGERGGAAAGCVNEVEAALLAEEAAAAVEAAVRAASAAGTPLRLSEQSWRRLAAADPGISLGGKPSGTAARLSLTAQSWQRLTSAATPPVSPSGDAGRRAQTPTIDEEPDPTSSEPGSASPEPGSASKEPGPELGGGDALVEAVPSPRVQAPRGWVGPPSRAQNAAAPRGPRGAAALPRSSSPTPRSLFAAAARDDARPGGDVTITECAGSHLGVLRWGDVARRGPSHASQPPRPDWWSQITLGRGSRVVYDGMAGTIRGSDGARGVYTVYVPQMATDVEVPWDSPLLRSTARLEVAQKVPERIWV